MEYRVDQDGIAVKMRSKSAKLREELLRDN
jgi:hypothetical protein